MKLQQMLVESHRSLKVLQPYGHTQVILNIMRYRQKEYRVYGTDSNKSSDRYFATQSEIALNDVLR